MSRQIPRMMPPTTRWTIALTPSQSRMSRRPSMNELATPRPWRFEVDKAWGFCVKALEKKYIAWRIAKQADAELIVSAVNQYEALLKCEKALRELFATVKGECPSCIHEDDSNIGFEVEQALAE